MMNIISNSINTSIFPKGSEIGLICSIAHWHHCNISPQIGFIHNNITVLLYCYFIIYNKLKIEN